MKVFALLKLSAINYNTANHSPVFKQDVYNVEVTLQELMAGGNGYMVAANILATDADADAVTYSIFTAENDPFGLLSSSSSTIIYTGQSVSTGTYSYYITAEDNHGASAYAEVNIHVIDSLNDPRTENTPPEIVLDDQDSIYEPDAEGYVTITGHLVDATNYSTTYGSTYQLKLLDANEDVYDAADITLNQGDLAFTVRINTIGFPNGLISFNLLAEEEVLGLIAQSDSTNTPIKIQTLSNQQKHIIRGPFVWLKSDGYTEAEMVETEKKFLKRLNEMRKLGGLAGYLAAESLKRLSGDGGNDGSLRIYFSRNQTPHSTIKNKDTIFFSPKDIANDFENVFVKGSSLGVMNDAFHRFVVVYGHELGHAMISLDDPSNLNGGKFFGEVLVLENMIRLELGIPFRKFYNKEDDNIFSQFDDMLAALDDGHPNRLQSPNDKGRIYKYFNKLRSFLLPKAYTINYATENLLRSQATASINTLENNWVKKAYDYKTGASWKPEDNPPTDKMKKIYTDRGLTL